MKTTNRRNLFILVFALLVVMLGFGMVIPIFLFLIDKLGSGALILCAVFFMSLIWIKEQQPLPSQGVKE